MKRAEPVFNLNDVVIFVEVAKQRSVSRTAELIGVPAATVSRRLRLLEDRLGVQLLSRTTRRIAFTEAGRLYYERCHQLIEQTLDAQDVLLDEGVHPRGQLKVLLPDRLDVAGLLAFVPSFARQWPALQFSCEYGYDENWERNRHFDVALRWGEQSDSDLVGRRLGQFEFRLYASETYLQQRGLPAHPDELAGHECLPSGLCPELATWRLARPGQCLPVTPQGHLSTSDLDLMRRFAQAGAGIAALPALMADETSLVPVLPGWRVASVALYALYGSRTPPARARIFVEGLIAHMQSLPPGDTPSTIASPVRRIEPGPVARTLPTAVWRPLAEPAHQ
ncbi:LysR family transcriptional regulator [Bordetella petrii]|uniref:LysR family transcriptional regulator n=1 Tax=Bordetella petrii TaxID=94624 RepID=UPI001E4FCF6D|nr:LysR family transcriptional regulator [Bordetella petrii]MCD0504799.1 LysR substrate-binding domain-containing protein [Bordetella petrii]